LQVYFTTTQGPTKSVAVMVQLGPILTNLTLKIQILKT